MAKPFVENYATGLWQGGWYEGEWVAGEREGTGARLMRNGSIKVSRLCNATMSHAWQTTSAKRQQTTSSLEAPIS